MGRDRTAQALILAAFCMMVGVGAIVSILPGRILNDAAPAQLKGSISGAYYADKG